MKKKILVSSPDYSEKTNHRYSKIGGGLFIYDLREKHIEHAIKGHFRQMIEVDNKILAIEYVENKLYVISKDMNVLDKYPLDKPNTCGIAYCPERKEIFISNAATDIINVYGGKNFKLKNKIEFSNKYRKTNVGKHHINDICIVDNSLYVSCFSVSGNWKRGVYDGGIVEFELDELNKAPNVLMNNLWQPHSVEYIDGDIRVLDSMRGLFYTGNQVVSGKFHGFLRGLTYDGRFYYVGQSETMYMSRLFGIADNIMLNSGFYMFDIETKVSRFFSIIDVINIHDLLVLQQ